MLLILADFPWTTNNSDIADSLQPRFALETSPRYAENNDSLLLGEQNVSLMQFKAPDAMAGFSLLEVLVAGTVFSIGLAGLSALLLTNIIGSAEARHQGTATVMAANLAEQISLNPLALNRYLNPPEYVSRLCMGAEQCSAEQQADYDFKLWKIELADNIRNANGVVCRDGTPQDGNEENSLCDGAGPMVIKIFWSGRMNTATQETNPKSNQQAGQHRFTFEVG